MKWRNLPQESTKGSISERLIFAQHIIAKKIEELQKTKLEWSIIDSSIFENELKKKKLKLERITTEIFEWKNISDIDKIELEFIENTLNKIRFEEEQPPIKTSRLSTHNKVGIATTLTWVGTIFCIDESNSEKISDILLSQVLHFSPGVIESTIFVMGILITCLWISVFIPKNTSK